MVHFLCCYFHFAFHGLDRSFKNDFKAFPSFDDFLLTFHSSKYFFSISPDLMKVESNRIARDSYRSGTTRTVAFDISQAFNRVFNASLLRKLKSYGISDQVFGLILSILNNRQLRLVLDRNFLEEDQDNSGVSQEFIFDPKLSSGPTNLPDNVSCNIFIYPYKYNSLL